MSKASISWLPKIRNVKQFADSNSTKQRKKVNTIRLVLWDKEKVLGRRKNGLADDLLDESADLLASPEKAIADDGAPFSSMTESDSESEVATEFLIWSSQLSGRFSLDNLVGGTVWTLFRRILRSMSADYLDEEVVLLDSGPNNKGTYSLRAVMRHTSESTRCLSDFVDQFSNTTCKGGSGTCSPASCHSCVFSIIKKAYKTHASCCSHVLFYATRFKKNYLMSELVLMKCLIISLKSVGITNSTTQRKVPIVAGAKTYSVLHWMESLGVVRHTIHAADVLIAVAPSSWETNSHEVKGKTRNGNVLLRKINKIDGNNTTSLYKSVFIFKLPKKRGIIHLSEFDAGFSEEPKTGICFLLKNLIVNFYADRSNDTKGRKYKVAKADEFVRDVAYLCDKEKSPREGKNGHLTDLLMSKLALPLNSPVKYIAYDYASASSTCQSDYQYEAASEFLRCYLQWLGRVQSQISDAKAFWRLFRSFLWVVSTDYRDKEVAVLDSGPNNEGPYVMRQTSESTGLSSDFVAQSSGTKCKAGSGICSPVLCHACIINFIIKQAYKKHVTLCGHVLFYVTRVDEINNEFNVPDVILDKVEGNCLVDTRLNPGHCKTLPVFAYCLFIWHGTHEWRRVLSISSEKAVKEYFLFWEGLPIDMQRVSVNGRPCVGGILPLTHGDVIRVSLRIVGGTKQPGLDPSGTSSKAPGNLNDICDHISLYFHQLEGSGDGPDEAVLETFSKDVSTFVPLVDISLVELLDELRKIPTPGFWPPMSVLAGLPCHRDYFNYTLAPFGGNGLVVKKYIKKGLCFCYQGPMHGAGEVNAYSLAVEGHGALGGALERSSAYIDGTPTEQSLLGGMNEFIWDHSHNNFILQEMGVIQASRDIHVGESAYMGYGENYNWDGYKTVLVHELANWLSQGVLHLGHPSHVSTVLGLAGALKTWCPLDLQHKRLGSSLERLVMSVVDNRVEIALHHSIFPTWLPSGIEVEPVGVWIERFLTCTNVIRLVGFRQAHDPRYPVVPLEIAISVAAAGIRNSSRLTSTKYYGEGCDGGGAEWGKLAPLTRQNDPVKNRAKLVKQGLSTEEAEAFKFADSTQYVWFGNPGGVSTWGLEVVVPRNNGPLSYTPKGKADERVITWVRTSPSARFRITYKVPGNFFATSHKEINDDGWCGWVAVEWLHRSRSHPACSPLLVSNPRDAKRLDNFLDNIAGSMAPGECRDVIHRCCLTLRVQSALPLPRASGLWFDVSYLKDIQLGFDVFVWGLDSATMVSILVGSSLWGIGPYRIGQIETAICGDAHLALSCGHFSCIKPWADAGKQEGVLVHLLTDLHAAIHQTTRSNGDSYHFAQQAAPVRASEKPPVCPTSIFKALGPPVLDEGIRRHIVSNIEPLRSLSAGAKAAPSLRSGGSKGDTLTQPAYPPPPLPPLSPMEAQRDHGGGNLPSPFIDPIAESEWKSPLVGSTGGSNIGDNGESVLNSARLYPIFRVRGGVNGSQHADAPPTKLTFDPRVLCIMHYNVGTITDPKVRFVCNQARLLCLDIIHLVDVGITLHTWPSVLHEFKRLLGVSQRVWAFDFIEGGIDPVSKACRVGGQIVMYTSRLTQARVTPIIKLGAAQGLYFNIGKTQYLSIGTYWPCSNPAPGSFQSHLSKAYGGLNASLTLKLGLESVIQSAVNSGRTILIGGDFNCEHAVGSQVFDWATQLGITNASTGVSLGRASFHSGGTASRIDHLYVSDPRIVILSSPYQLQYCVTQHLPMLTKIDVEYCQSKVVYQTRKRGNMMHSAISRANRIKVKCEVLISSNRLVGSDPIGVINTVTGETVNVCTIVSGRRRERDGWSPETKGLTINLVAIQHMVRFCNPSGLHRMWDNGWSAKNFRPHLNKILREWRWEGRKACRTLGDMDRYLNLSPYGEGYWHKIKWVTLVGVLPLAHKTVKSMLQGAERKLRRDNVNDHTAMLQGFVAKGKTGVAIRAVLGPKKAGFDLSTLRIDGEESCDQNEIGLATTAHFRNWFSERVPSLFGCLGGPSARWEDMFSPQHVFVSNMENGGIPRAIAESMWPHFQRRRIPRGVLTDFHTRLAQPVTLSEWLGRIERLPKKSSGGPSGLTYDMIQAWTPEVHLAVLDAHNELWDRKVIPESWHRKWLVLVPKGDSGTLDDLRPLMLIEALRKVWTGIFLVRIQSFFDINKILHKSQHGTAKGMGTDTAAPILFNTLETAREWCSTVYISSWDVKRAFDSISREYQVGCLVRLGVPAFIASYLIHMDGGGDIAVKTPLHLSENSALGGWDNVREAGHTFTAERGTGQGDPLSPLIFACCLDPLLCALGSVTHGGFFVQGVSGDAHSVPDIAYVDDAISLSGSFEAIQAKADIMSAFAVMINIELSLKKLRTFGIVWGNATRTHHSTLTVHIDNGTSSWHPVEVPLLGAGEFTHLGVTYDMHLDNQTLFTKALNTVDTLGHKVVISKMNADTKKMIFETSIYMKINYYAKFCPWTLAQYRMIDSKVSKYYRLISRNMATYPSKVLYFPIEDGGLGFKRFSDVSQSSKLALLGRLIVGSGPSRVAMEAIFERGFRAAGQYLPPRMGGAMGPSLGSTSWITSLQEWLGEIGVRLRKHGVPSQNGNPQIIDLPGVTHEQRLTASRAGVSFIGDVFMLGDEESPVPGMEWVRKFPPALRSRIELRVGQVWFLAEHEHKLFEIVSFTKEDTMCVLWDVGFKPGDHGPLGRGARVHMTEGNACRGAGGGKPIATTYLTNGVRGTRRLVFLSEERHYREGVTGCTILGSRERCPDAGREWTSPTLFKELAQVASEASEIYTDGSYSKTSSAAGLYSGVSNTVTGAGLALYLPDANEFHKVHIKGDSSLTNSYMTEMVALSLGVRLAASAGQVVYSDCAAALGSLRQLQAKKFHTSPYWQLDLFLDLDYSVRTEKVKAHPENRVIPVYSLQDRGITAADDCAGSAKFAHRSVSLQEVLEVLSSFSKITLVNDDNTIAVDNLAVRRVERDKREYVRRRDEYRAARQLPPKWGGLNLRLGAYTLGCGKNGVAARGCASRIQFDWHYLGSNRVKSGAALADDLKCPLCGGCENQHHILTACRHPLMSRVRDRVWGTLGAFLEDVRKGTTPLALDESRAIARADPKKEAARLKRAADRDALVAFREGQARARLTSYQYMLRRSFAAARTLKRAETEAKLKVAAINAAMVIHHLMWSHPEGWTLMVGMPSASVTQLIDTSILSNLSMRGYVAAELRRLQRAIGMSTWDIMTCHNRQVGGLNAVTTMDDFLEDEAEAEAQIFRDGGTTVRARWASGRRTLRGHRLRQASLASWALPSADAVILLDLLEYDLDTAVIADLDACDAKSFHIVSETTALPCTGVIGNLSVPSTNAPWPGKGREPSPLKCEVPLGGTSSMVLAEASARSRRLDTFNAKRNGSFVFSHVVDSGKHTVSPFAITAGLPRLPGLMEVIQYSPIIRPYMPTKRKFKVRIDGPVLYSLRPESFSGTAATPIPLSTIQSGTDLTMKSTLTVVNTHSPGPLGSRKGNNETEISTGARVMSSPIYHVESPSEAMVVCAVGCFSLSSDSTSGDNRIISRQVGPGEVALNSSKIPGSGYCGYVSLELASRFTRGHGNALNLETHGDREILRTFLIALSTECGHAPREKLAQVAAALRGPSPSVLPIASGLWMRTDDISGFNLPFPVVLWGADLGDGWRRVMYPDAFNRHISMAQCMDVVDTECHMVWHDNHYFLLDSGGFGHHGLRDAWSRGYPQGIKRALGDTHQNEGMLMPRTRHRAASKAESGHRVTTGYAEVGQPVEPLTFPVIHARKELPAKHTAILLEPTRSGVAPTDNAKSAQAVEPRDCIPTHCPGTAGIPWSLADYGCVAGVPGAGARLAKNGYPPIGGRTAPPSVGTLTHFVITDEGSPGSGNITGNSDMAPFGVAPVSPALGVVDPNEVFLWDRIGIWAFSRYPGRTRSNNMLVARCVNAMEIERNVGRTKSDGLCGWTSLEWASRAEDFPDGGLDPDRPDDRRQLVTFMRMLITSACGNALLKVHGVLNYLHGIGTRPLPKSSGWWLGIEDVHDLHLPFPLVVWGSDTGDGWRRVMHPPRWNMGVDELDARSIMTCEAQIVLDCGHFFPVDTVLIIPTRISNRQRQEPGKDALKRIRQLDPDSLLTGAPKLVAKAYRRPRKLLRRGDPDQSAPARVLGDVLTSEVHVDTATILTTRTQPSASTVVHPFGAAVAGPESGDASKDGGDVTASLTFARKREWIPSLGPPGGSRGEDNQEDDSRSLRHKADVSDTGRRGPPVRDKKRKPLTQSEIGNPDSVPHRYLGTRLKCPRGEHGDALVEPDEQAGYQEPTWVSRGDQPHYEAGHEKWLSAPYGISGDFDRGEATEDDGQDGRMANGHGGRTSARQGRMRSAETVSTGQGDGEVAAALGFKARPGLDRDKEDVAAERAVATQVGEPELLEDQPATSGP